MKTDTYDMLKRISEKHGPQEFGGICQDLLALSFFEITDALSKLEVKDVEGVDIVLDSNLGKYVIEVKTTTKDTVNFEQKDHKWLKSYEEKKYTPILAVLKLALLSEWIFHDPKRLTPKSNLSVNRLYTADEFKKLAEDVNKKFESLVEEHYERILSEGRIYLIDELKLKGIKKG